MIYVANVISCVTIGHHTCDLFSILDRRSDCDRFFWLNNSFRFENSWSCDTHFMINFYYIPLYTCKVSLACETCDSMKMRKKTQTINHRNNSILLVVNGCWLIKHWLLDLEKHFLYDLLPESSLRSHYWRLLSKQASFGI